MKGKTYTAARVAAIVETKRRKHVDRWLSAIPQIKTIIAANYVSIIGVLGEKLGILSGEKKLHYCDSEITAYSDHQVKPIRILLQEIGLWSTFKNTPKLPVKVQRLPVDIYYQFLEDLRNLKMSFRDIEIKYALYPGSASKVRKTLGIHPPDKNKNTTPELFFEKICQELKLTYEKQKKIIREDGYYFIVDFYFPGENKIVEVQGDYWHANPRMFPDKNKWTMTQLANFLRDTKKREWAKRQGYGLEEVWEYDLRHDLQNVQEKLKRFLLGD